MAILADQTMIMISESGSTKCDSILLNAKGQEVTRFTTMGFNPYFHTAELIYDELGKVSALQSFGSQIQFVFFYGAGCSSAALNDIVKQGISKALPTAEVKVDHDLLAAAYSTYRGVPQISCIIGTGSNSVFFDGRHIYEEVPALAYILGDEGSGSYLGKKLLSTYLYKKLPPDLLRSFESEFGLSKDEIIYSVYNRPNANVWLASFAKFFGENKNHEWIRRVVKEGFEAFRDIHILCFKEAQSSEVNFVGSVAFHFRDILQSVLEEKGLHFGYVLERPLEGLVAYHIQYLKILENQGLHQKI